MRCGSPHTRYEREWISYDLKGNKVKCPPKSNGDTKIFVWHSQKENGETHMCDIHTKGVAVYTK